MIRALSIAALLATTAPAFAQSPAGNSAPHPVPFTDTIPKPRDVAYPGTMTLDVDATNVQQGIFRVKQTIPVAKSGHMVLLYPKWIPGKHGPRGEIDKLAGLKFFANGQQLEWTRDPVDVFAFHINVPKGAKTVEAEFQFLSATKSDQGRIVMAPSMMNLQWYSLSLYPAGYYTRRIPVVAMATYPEGWSAASAVPARKEGSTYTYDKVDYEVLVDSPVFAGRYYRDINLGERVDLNVFADSPEELAATPEQIEKHRNLVTQAIKLFGAEHYDRYEFLFAISAEMGGIGVEHHRSSENGTGLGYFTKWDEQNTGRNLLAHEYTHSWVGKYRRGADQITADFRQPMRNSMLWAYEGHDQFLGYVLGARAGLMTKEDTLEVLASYAALQDTRPGRKWRSILDTTNDPIITARAPKGWLSYQRSEDYYVDGLMTWMNVDAILREKSGGTKSIDDYDRAFYGMRDGDYGDLPFTIDDIVKTLNGIVPYDWRTLFDEQINKPTEGAPLQGFEKNGYRLVYTDKPNKATPKTGLDLMYSLGLAMGPSGISQVMWDGPAFKVGIDLGDEILAVNGRGYTADRLKAAVIAAKDGKDPIRLLLKSGDHFREVSIDYHGGLRYPHLEKIGDGEAGLDKLLTPK
ncbi:MAG: M61 family metallopeptidase [Sphingomonas sp.]|uniref:M61 family metallopeptidase n=1 Tax=Sphingomonas sp. TaxID=28214 RepID=UPI0025F36373|nr:collagenase [Sphingomonas sp.]MBX3563388.1 M61 family metallopeptidase [Sphingomonas sp.]